MKTTFVALVASAATIAAGTATAQTSGYTRYSASYTVQNRTSGCGGWSYSSGIFRSWVCAGEERVEQRWANWPQQSRYNQWEGEINFTSGTQKTCIMQIKSNTGGEPIYIQVTTSGTLRNDAASVFATGMANQWFRLNAYFNPASGDSRAFINGSQVVSRNYPTSARDWYFKNGTYNNGLASGQRSEASFRNVSHWVLSSSTSPTPTPRPTATPSTATPTPTPATPTPTPCSGCGGSFSGYYRIMARHSGKAVVVQSASTANSANVFQWAYGGTTTNDEWEIRSIGSGYYRIINRHSGKDLTVQSASTAEGADIFQYTYGGTTTNDEWAIVDLGNGYHRITNRHSGKSAEVAAGSTADGANIAQRTYGGQTYQQFQPISVP